MNLDLYSDRAKQAVQSAQSLALARRHQQFAPEHLLKVLLEERDGLARNLITAAGGDARRAEADIETALSKRAQVTGGSGQLYLDGDTAHNDLVSIGRAPNVAAKLSALRDRPPITVTADVYNGLTDSRRYDTTNGTDIWLGPRVTTVGPYSLGLYSTWYRWKP